MLSTASTLGIYREDNSIIIVKIDQQRVSEFWVEHKNLGVWMKTLKTCMEYISPSSPASAWTFR